MIIFMRNLSASGESVHDYDVVIGPIANDKVGVQIRKYVDKEISLKNQEILLLLKYVL